MGYAGYQLSPVREEPSCSNSSISSVVVAPSKHTAHAAKASSKPDAAAAASPPQPSTSTRSGPSNGEQDWPSLLHHATTLSHSHSKHSRTHQLRMHALPACRLAQQIPSHQQAYSMQQQQQQQPRAGPAAARKHTRRCWPRHTTSPAAAAAAPAAVPIPPNTQDRSCRSIGCRSPAQPAACQPPASCQHNRQQQQGKQGEQEAEPGKLTLQAQNSAAAAGGG